MSILENINFFSVIVSIIVFGFLGFFVFFSNKKSATNKAFLFFALISVFWNIANYLSYQFNSTYTILWFARLTIFFAVWYVFSIFNFIYIFPKEKAEFSVNYKKFLVPYIALVSVLTLTSFVFKDVKIIGDVFKVENGYGIYLFGATVVSLLIFGIYTLIKKMIIAKGMERSQYEFVLTGITITFLLHIIFNFILPSFFNDLRFISMGGIFTFPFLALTTYAIFKHHLFNLKVISAEILTFSIWIALFAKIFISESGTDRIIGIIIFLFTFVFGIFLIRSVLNKLVYKFINFSFCF